MGELDSEDFQFKLAFFIDAWGASEEISIHNLRKQTEQKAMLGALALCNGNRSKAALSINMSRAVFFRRMKEYGIK